MPVYLDCAATTPLDDVVRQAMFEAFEKEFGNAGSRTHQFGQSAKSAVVRARQNVAAIAACEPGEVIFTSGATEANNLAILGLASHGEKEGRRHVIASAIEHKAVLGPLEALQARGFEVTYLAPDSDGLISPDAIRQTLRPDTLLVSVMHANNETGAVQPIAAIADVLEGAPAYFHVDAAQSFGKLINPLRHRRIDLVSVSAHKMFGPKGVGALIARSRRFQRPPLAPLMFGGGQERGLRPGTIPVPLIVGLGVAAEQALQEESRRHEACQRMRADALEAFSRLEHVVLSPAKASLNHILSVAFRGVDSEALILATKDLVAISNGSACTSARYEPSHVLLAMNLPENVVSGVVRLSWCHLTPLPPWAEFAARVQELQGRQIAMAS